MSSENDLNQGNNMLKCENLIVSNINDVIQGIDNWFLLNKEKKVKFIIQLYIPREAISMKKDDSLEEFSGFFLISIYYKFPNK